jgi:hypothetical protein
MDDRRKNYRAWDAQQNRHDSVSPRDALPEDDLVFFLLDLIPQIDLAPFHQFYAQETRGQPPFDVTMMVTLLVYAYSVGIRSSRKIAAGCEHNLAFRAIVGKDRPDFRTISDFRKIHLAALVSRSAAPGWRDADGQGRESIHRRHKDENERVAAQGDELRLYEQTQWTGNCGAASFGDEPG